MEGFHCDKYFNTQYLYPSALVPDIAEMRLKGGGGKSDKKVGAMSYSRCFR